MIDSLAEGKSKKKYQKKKKKVRKLFMIRKINIIMEYQKTNNFVP